MFLDGRLVEQPMFDLMTANIDRHLSTIGPSGGDDLIAKACAYLASFGITSCTDASTEPEAFAALRHAELGGRLPIRSNALINGAGVRFR